MVMLRAHRLQLWYGATQALADASVKVDAREVVALMGPSGSGKSSLLHCLAGLLRPNHGTVHLDGMALHESSDDVLSDVRRAQFGFVFQFAELVPELTLSENMALPLELNRVPRAEVRDRVDVLIEALDLSGQAHRRPDQVSGGQAQRAAIGRAIAHRPRVIFADEPTGSLDADNGAAALELMLQLVRADAAAMLIVTHEDDVAGVADRVVRVLDGRTEPSG